MAARVTFSPLVVSQLAFARRFCHHAYFFGFNQLFLFFFSWKFTRAAAKRKTSWYLLQWSFVCQNWFVLHDNYWPFLFFETFFRLISKTFPAQKVIKFSGRARTGWRNPRSLIVTGGWWFGPKHDIVCAIFQKMSEIFENFLKLNLFFWRLYFCSFLNTCKIPIV